MPYSAWDEYFVHQLPRTLDHVHDSEKSWSDRCYFNLYAPDASSLITMGYGNNPNTQRVAGYVKVALADGRHWDLDVFRRCIDDRGDLYAGPMRLTCVEPLERWHLELGPNDSGIEYDLEYHARAPMWELLPIVIRKRGRTIADMTHIKQPGRYTGWVSIDGERQSVDGFHGGRDRTFGVRAAEEVDFWLWFEAGFEDRAIEAWIWESADGTINYVDGGIVFADGTLSKRFVKFEHEVTFDGDRKRTTRADIVFTDEDGHRYEVSATSEHLDTTAYYSLGSSRARQGDGYSWYTWNGTVAEDLDEVEGNTIALDQLMRFEVDGLTGHGIFELLLQGRGYARYPTWVLPQRNR